MTPISVVVVRVVTCIEAGRSDSSQRDKKGLQLSCAAIELSMEAPVLLCIVIRFRLGKEEEKKSEERIPNYFLFYQRPSCCKEENVVQ